MPTKKLNALLDDQKVDYESIKHDPAYDAQLVAASAHISGKELAKSVIVHIYDKLAMAVLPAAQHVYLGHLKSALSAKYAELATESEPRNSFPTARKAPCCLSAISTNWIPTSPPSWPSA